jgi:hypothetical protein
MHRVKKRRSLNLLKTGLIGCQAKKLATPPRPHALINLAVDNGRRSTRRRPAIHPTLPYRVRRGASVGLS